MLNSLLLISIVFGETFAGYTLNNHDLSQADVIWYFYAFHAIASILTGALISRVVPESWQPQRRVIHLLAVMVAFFIPIFGVALLLVLGGIVVYHGGSGAEFAMQLVMPPNHFTKTTVAPPKFGVGGAVARLLKDSLPTPLRTEALLALSAHQSPQSNALMRRTLSDSADQIRLLAFSLLDQQEKKISERISKLLKKYQQQRMPKPRAELAKLLAQQYWELVYQDLVQGELRQQVLTMALQYAEAAWQTLNHDPKLTILISKIAYAQGDIQKTQAMLKIANEMGAKSSQVLPYLAAISFDHRDFKAVRDYLSRDKNIDDIPKLHAVVKFWSRQDA